MSRAATPFVSLEPEAGTRTGTAALVQDTTASGGSAVRFAATPTPPPTQPPVIGNPAWRGDYQNGWAGWRPDQQYARPAQLAILTAASVGIPTRAGFPYVGRYITAPGDLTASDRDRGEVYASEADSGNPTNGQTMWWAWSVYIPSGFVVDANSVARRDAAGLPSSYPVSPVGNGWLIAGQWHGSADSGPGPNIDLSFSKETYTPHLVLSTNGGSGSGTPLYWVQPTAFPLGQWVDMRIGITWGTSSSTGRMTVKTNGTTWLNNVPSANLYPGQSAYFKQGIYRARSNQTHTIYYTGTRRGPTEASVSY